VELRGGWDALTRAGLSSPAIEELWARREAALAVLDGLPRVPTHGDAHPVNLLGRDGDEVIAIDWEQFGLGPAGFDLGYLLLATDAPLDDLVTAYGGGRCGAVLVAAYTGVSRAAWAIDRPDPGEHLQRLAKLAATVEEGVELVT